MACKKFYCPACDDFPDHIESQHLVQSYDTLKWDGETYVLKGYNILFDVVFDENIFVCGVCGAELKKIIKNK